VQQAKTCHKKLTKASWSSESACAAAKYWHVYPHHEGEKASEGLSDRDWQTVPKGPERDLHPKSLQILRRLRARALILQYVMVFGHIFDYSCMPPCLTKCTPPLLEFQNLVAALKIRARKILSPNFDL
jgi:hypothetical protein